MICFLRPAPFDVINLIHIGWTAPAYLQLEKAAKAWDRDLSSVQEKAEGRA